MEEKTKKSKTVRRVVDYIEIATAIVLVISIMLIFTFADTDQTTPSIDNVTSTSITDDSVSILWETNEPATSDIKYGVVSGIYDFEYTNDDYYYCTPCLLQIFLRTQHITLL